MGVGGQRAEVEESSGSALKKYADDDSGRDELTVVTVAAGAVTVVAAMVHPSREVTAVSFKNIPTDVDWSAQMVGVMIGAALMRILFSVFLMFGTILDASLITDCSSSFLSIELGILTSISSSVETSSLCMTKTTLWSLMRFDDAEMTSLFSSNDSAEEDDAEIVESGTAIEDIKFKLGPKAEDVAIAVEQIAVDVAEASGEKHVGGPLAPPLAPPLLPNFIILRCSRMRKFSSVSPLISVSYLDINSSFE